MLSRGVELCFQATGCPSLPRRWDPGLLWWWGATVASGECLEWVPSSCGAPQRPGDGKRGDISLFWASHWLTWEDEEEKVEEGRWAKTEDAWEWLILSFTAQQLWHITNVMAVIDSLCAISLWDKDAPKRGGAVTYRLAWRPATHSQCTHRCMQRYTPFAGAHTFVFLHGCKVAFGIMSAVKVCWRKSIAHLQISQTSIV